MAEVSAYKWFEKNFDSINEYFEGSRVVDASTGKASFTGFAFDDVLEIISSGFQTKTDSLDGLKRIAVRQLLFDGSWSHPITLEEMTKRLREKLRTLRGREKRYTFLAGIYAQGELKQRRFAVNGSIIMLYPPTVPLPKRVLKLARIQEEGFQNISDYESVADRKLNKTVLTISLSARSSEEAGSLAYDRFDEFRGILNFIRNYGKHSASSWGQSQETRVFNNFVGFRYSSLHDGGSGELVGSYLQKHWKLPSVIGKLSGANAGIFHENVESCLKGLRSKHGLSADCWKALGSYASSLDTPGYQAAFLKAWSLLEFLTVINPGDDHTKIVRRVSFLYSDVGAVRLMLDHLRHRRNELVHSGGEEEFVSEEKLVHQINRYLVRLLNQYIFNHHNFSNRSEFAQFLDCSVDVSFLEKRVSLFSRALDFRK